MTVTSVPVANRDRASCCERPQNMTLPCPPASWLATAGAMSRPAAVPGAKRSCSILDIEKKGRSFHRTVPYTHCPRQPRGYCVISSRRQGGMMRALSQLRVKIFADGADKAEMLERYRNPLVKGFTTNPT